MTNQPDLESIVSAIETLLVSQIDLWRIVQEISTDPAIRENCDRQLEVLLLALSEMGLEIGGGGE